MKPAAIYVRVSTASQEQDGTSLATQEARCRAFAADHGHAVAGVYSDTHTGAELWEREDLSRLREDIAARRVRAVIVYALDRLSRRPAHQIIIAEECARAGVELLCVTEPIDRSPEGMLISYVRGYAAEVEREKIRERSIRGKLARLQAGKLVSEGHDLFGYLHNRDAGTRDIHEPEAMIVRECFRRVCTGDGLQQIANDLNDRGVPSRRGGTPKWNRVHVAKIIHNPAYRGETFVWRNRRPPSEWLRLPDHVTPPIVPNDLWHAAQAALGSRRSRDHSRNAGLPFLLRGRIWCGVCGRRLNCDRFRNKTVHVYRCGARLSGPPCGASAVYADGLEGWVWEQVASVLQDPQTIIDELARRQDSAVREAGAAELKRARRQLAQIEAGAKRLLALYRRSKDRLSWRPFEAELAEADRERAVVIEEIARLEQELDASAAIAGAAADLDAWCRTVSTNIAGLDFAGRRLAIDALDVRVTATREDWQLAISLPVQRCEVNKMVIRFTERRAATLAIV